MEWLFWVSFLLTLTEGTGNTESCLSQKSEIWQKAGTNVALPCTVSHHCSSSRLKYEWFIFKENYHFNIDLQGHPLKYKLVDGSLHISLLQANDSGIYYCAALASGKPTRGTQHVGLGTTLVVKEKTTVMVRNTLLWLAFALLFVYSLAVVTLIVKRNGCNMGICRRTEKPHRHNSTKKIQFQDVLQEMYRRGNMGRSKQTVSRSRPQAEAASADLNRSMDDIYQNV